MRGRTRLVVALVVLLALVGVGVVVLLRSSLSPFTTPQERYCRDAVARRAELTDVLSSDRPDALLQALPVFSDLADRAPDDLADEWEVVIGALDGLRRALSAAGVDPATYDRESPPAGLDDAAQGRIDAAAAELGSPATGAALNGIDQQARDVCGTPLTQ